MGRTTLYPIFKFVTGLVTALFFVSCASVKSTHQANSYDVEYYDVDVGVRALRLVQINAYGQAEYFENIQRLIRRSVNEGYEIYYEKVDTTGVTDLEWRKVRRMFGFVPNDLNFKKSLSLPLMLGYQHYPIEYFIALDSIEVHPLSYYPDGLAEAYESTYGIIELNGRDSLSPLKRKASQKLPAKNSSQVIEEYRKSHFWDMLVDTAAKRKLVLLDSKIHWLFGDEVNNFERLDAEITKVSTKNDTLYIQPQTAKSIRGTGVDHIIQEGYIDDMSDFASFKTAYIVNTELFDINYLGQRYMLMPNSNSQLKFSVQYKAITLGASWRPRFLEGNNDIDKKGKTKGFDLDINIVKPNWFQDIRWRFIKGFYLHNTGDFDPDWREAQPYIQEPDYLYTSIEGVSGVKFNPHFSLKSLTSQVERQLRSCGSFIGAIGYRYYATQDENQPHLIDSISRSSNFEIGFHMGYYYTFVLPANFYFSLGSTTGFGYVTSRFTAIEDGEAKKRPYREVMFNLNGRTTLGYNGVRLFGGIYTEFKGGAFLKETPIVNTTYRGILQVFVGYRFEAPRLIRSSRLN